jgi:hypothetical protein
MNTTVIDLGHNPALPLQRIRRHIGVALLVGAAAILRPVSSEAAAILIAPNTALYQVDFYEPIGQSFTAEDPYVSAGLYFRPINPLQANDDQVQYELRQGADSTGALLASSAFFLPSGSDGFFHMVDFSSVSLTPGAVYNLTASILGDSRYWGIGGSSASYAGGASIFDGAGDVTRENALSVQPVSATVSEPASMLLLSTGLAGAGLRRWRQKGA